MDSPKRDQSYVKHDAEEKNTRGLKKNNNKREVEMEDENNVERERDFY